MEFREFTAQPQKSAESVMEFIGVDPAKYTFKPVPMWSGERRGRRMHPAVKKKLRQYFAIPNQKLYAIVGKAYSWDAEMSSSEDEEHAITSTGEHLIIPLSDQFSEKEKKSYATAVNYCHRLLEGKKAEVEQTGQLVSLQ
eukprot:jgi/Picre1/27424/NNA_000391.t1